MVVCWQRVGRMQWVAVLVLMGGGLSSQQAWSDETEGDGAEPRVFVDVLNEAQWSQLDHSIDRGLTYLSTQQADDGSFETFRTGQPGVTSLCVMAFLSRGHVPDGGPYGRRISRAIDYVLAQQREDGLLFSQHVEERFDKDNGFHTCIYNHAIAGLMLSEVYGMTDEKQQDKLRQAIEKAIDFSRKNQTLPKRRRDDLGGWRYAKPGVFSTNDSDLSVTAWQVTFLRSARNAEFDVPTEMIGDAMDYVRSCFAVERGTFVYNSIKRKPSGGVVGGGVLSLSLGGEHNTEIARRGGDWILARRNRRYNGPGEQDMDRYHYAAYYTSQAMFQLGGKYWAGYYPVLMQTLTTHQRPDGSWEPERIEDASFGSTYTTALAILALSPPYQLLPIYQY
ncbi:MAG: terpene cyclase/mutase family protein [Planctomycetaceae bacterium]|nr:terpene cyclase/mutase family protein [Planctomycetaceae bacterium]